MKVFEHHKDKNEVINIDTSIDDEQHHYNDSCAFNHSENASDSASASVSAQDTNGLIFVAYVASYGEINQETFEEVSIEDENHEWHKAGTELESRLEELRNSAEGYGYNFSDCQVSLAEYAEPELDEKNIISIKSLVLRIFHNENFYCSTLEEAREALLEYCREDNISTYTFTLSEIFCVTINGGCCVEVVGEIFINVKKNFSVTSFDSLQENFFSRYVTINFKKIKKIGE